MAYAASPYRENYPQWVKITGLVVLFVAQYFTSGLNGDIGGRVTSYFGLDSNRVSFYLHMGTVGMLALLPLTYRFRSYFRRISLLMWTLGLQLVITLLCYFTEQEFILMLSSLIMGALKIIVILDFLSLLIGMFPILRNRGIFYGVFYGFARSVREISTYVTLKIVENYNWQDVFLVSAVAIVFTILLCLFLFQTRRTQRRVPLYQAEWISALLMVVMGLSLDYALIMGKELDWFSSRTIIYASLIFVGTTIYFVYRQYHVKRPYWDFRIFSKYKQIPIGAILMIMMYLYYAASTLFHVFIDYNFQGEENYLAHFGMVNLVCYLIFFPLAGWMVYKEFSRRMMVCFGFLCFAFSLINYSSIIQESLSFWNLVPSLVLSSVGYAFLLTNAAAYLATNIPRKDNRNRVMVTISARYVLGSFIASSLYTNWLYHRIGLHKSHFLESFNFNNSIFMKNIHKFSETFVNQGDGIHQARLKALKLLEQKVEIKAMLLSIREIAFVMGIAAIIIAIIALFVRHLEMHKEEGKNKYKITPW